MVLLKHLEENPAAWMPENFRMGDQRVETEMSRLMVHLSSVEQMIRFWDLTKEAVDSQGLKYCDFSYCHSAY